MSKSQEHFGFVAQRRAQARPERMPSSPLWGLLAWLLLAAAMVGLVYLGFRIWERSAPGEVTVPDVVGVTVDAARSMLGGKRLPVEVSAYRASESVPKDHVLAAHPQPGKVVKQGRVVRLVVSTGKGWTAMPDLRDMPVERAVAICREEGLKPARQRYQYDEAPSGYVISQVPAAGAQAPAGAEVTLIVSRGPAPEMAYEPGRKYAEVTVSLPISGSRRHVEIVVVDDEGLHVAYSQWCEPGTTVTERVSGEGRVVTVRAHVDGAIIKQQVLE